MAPCSPQAALALRSYYADIVSRYHCRAAGEDEIDAAIRDEPSDDLVEARRLYARHGYREVARFNDDPYAEHWFAKPLSPDRWTERAD